jgi:photosystem II stability/assembly factor-like uncharacterized protein
MKNLYLVVLILILLSSFTTRCQWIRIPSGTTNNLTQMDFPNSLTGYILGKGSANSNELLKTIDGGFTWSPVFNHDKMYCFDFLTIDTGVVISYDSIYQTCDGGISWNAVSRGFNGADLFHMNSSLEWFIISAQGSGYTTDGGITWINGSTFGTIPLVPTDFQFINDSTVIGVGWYSTKSFISNDHGLHFQDLSFFNPIGSGAIYSVCFPSPDIGYVTGTNRILKSTDGGVNYTNIDSTLGFDIKCLRSLDANTFYGVGYYGGIAKTVDGGINWGIDITTITTNLNKITFINSHTAIAVGDSGIILMNSNITTGIEIGYLSADLVSVFPNPSTNNVTIKINAEPQMKFILYNSLGEKQIEKTLTSPTNNINMSAYSNDIYYYVLSNENSIIKSGKIIKQ